MSCWNFCWNLSKIRLPQIKWFSGLISLKGQLLRNCTPKLNYWTELMVRLFDTIMLKLFAESGFELTCPFEMQALIIRYISTWRFFFLWDHILDTKILSEIQRQSFLLPWGFEETIKQSIEIIRNFIKFDLFSTKRIYSGYYVEYCLNV